MYDFVFTIENARIFACDCSFMYILILYAFTSTHLLFAVFSSNRHPRAQIFSHSNLDTIGTHKVHYSGH